MIFSIDRITAPVLDRIPDISHQPRRWLVSIGLGASIVLHLLLLLFALVVGKIMPERAIRKFAKTKPRLQEIELTVIPMAPASPTAPRVVPLEEIEHPTPFIDSRGLTASTKPPEQPVFESDQHMLAASEKPATGSAPLPSQEGRETTNVPQFQDIRMTLGKAAQPSPEAALSHPPVAQQIPPVPITPAEAAAPKESPTPAKAAEQTKPASTPPPIREMAKPSADEIALHPKATPAPVAETPLPSPPPPTRPALPRPQMRASVAMLAAPTAPTAPARPASGYQPLQEKTRIEGNISNRGRNAVDAIGTPLGRYKKSVIDAVGSRWYYYTEKKRDVIAPGSVRVSWSVDGRGRVVGVHAEDNTSNASFAEMCERALLDAEIAPPPADLVKPLLDGKLDFSITFTFHTY